MGRKCWNCQVGQTGAGSETCIILEMYASTIIYDLEPGQDEKPLYSLPIPILFNWILSEQPLYYLFPLVYKASSSKNCGIICAALSGSKAYMRGTGQNHFHSYSRNIAFIPVNFKTILGFLHTLAGRFLIDCHKKLPSSCMGKYFMTHNASRIFISSVHILSMGVQRTTSFCFSSPERVLSY